MDTTDFQAATERHDVVIAGAGNAALSAAHAAAEQVERVLVLEKAPPLWLGGNSLFTAGMFRIAHAGFDDLWPLLDDITAEQRAVTDLPTYTPADFRADMQRVTQARTDSGLCDILVNDSRATLAWLHDKGLRFTLRYDRQAYDAGGRFQFWGGLAVGSIGGGGGLMAQHVEAASRERVDIRCGCGVIGLRTVPDGTVTGVVYRGPHGVQAVEAGAVVLACGGFEADPRLRAAYLGPGWDIAKVRGTPYNTGEGLMAALDIGAQAYGHWSGCHAVPWDAGAPSTGDLGLTNLYSRLRYPLGIMLNMEAQRFVDEGADFRNYTYARYGAEVLRQPCALAFQIYDAKTAPLLSQDEYDAPGASRVVAPTVEALAIELGLDPQALARTVASFNAAAQPGTFDPAIKDGKGTRGIDPPKSNWAQPLDTPPYYGFAVTAGVTFTFGGVRIDSKARVLDRNGEPILGLYAAGELVGGLFYHNYPGGTGLTAGAVFGRRAGGSAAAWARSRGASVTYG